MTSGPNDNLSALLKMLPDCFLQLDGRGKVLAHLSGGVDDPLLRPGDLPGKSLEDFLPGDVAVIATQQLRKAFRTREVSSTEFSLGPRGREQHYELRFVVTGRERALAVIRDQSRGNSQVAQRRGTFIAVDYAEHIRNLQQAIADADLRERGLVLLCIGFENMVEIRRLLGQAITDDVLDVACARIEHCLRDGDQLHIARNPAAASSQLARLTASGELIVILRDVSSSSDAGEIAGRIRAAFADPLTVNAHRFDLTPHTGIAAYPLDGDDAEELLQNARTALDEARVRGDATHQAYTDTTRHRVCGRADVCTELEWAIEGGQLELRYLPRVDLGTGQVAGLEALLRWNHPLRGEIGLHELIPLAQAGGLMPVVGRWVLETACAQAAEWRKTWLALPPVGVNLSMQEFARQDLADVVAACLADAGLPAEALEFEVTEAMLMREEKSAAQLRRLAKIGVGIIIDDFGCGYSSLTRMSELPIKAIKIDRPIIDRSVQDASARAICAAIIAMAGHLGLTVIAEGVETTGQIDFLREQGCDALQGFFFTEPLPATEVPAFLTAHLGATPDGEPLDLPTIRTRFALRSE